MGVVAVFTVEIVALVRVATGGEDSAAVWSILLLIFTPLAVVGIIGGGIARAIRDREKVRDRGDGRQELNGGTTSSNEEER